MHLAPPKRLLIVGAGGHGCVIADAAEASGTWDEIAFLDDRYNELGKSLPWKVIGRLEDAWTMREHFSSAAVGLGSNRRRLQVMEVLLSFQYELPPIIHPSAIISKRARIGEGSVFLAGSIVNFGAMVGRGCILNSGAVLEHDGAIEDGVHLSPNASLAGGVRVGEASWIGIGACVKPGVTIGRNAIVGAGAAVVSDVDDDLTVAGVPARVLLSIN